MIPEKHISYRGPSEYDEETLAQLPLELRNILSSINGFIAFGGGLHVRGACRLPLWHSLANIWRGQLALFQTYDHLKPDDIPFAQDCMGDQFLLRNGNVFRLTLETAFLDNLTMDLGTFLSTAEANPVDFLQMQPLQQLQASGFSLLPGQLIHAYPPFSTAQSADGVDLRAISADEQIAFELDFYQSIKDLKDGETFHIKVIP